MARHLQKAGQEGTESSSDHRRALVIAAHPDDAEFGCAGTAALWSKDGWEFYYLVCTDGSKGSDDPEMIPEKLVPLRRHEQVAAARLLGVQEVFFLDFVDGHLAYTPEFMREVVRHIRKVKPLAVFTSDPSQVVRNQFINHPDHRCVGTVALDAVYPVARNRPSFPELLAEGLEPHRVQDVYLWSSGEPNFEVDITTVADLKFQALLAHESQVAAMRERLPELRERWKDPDGSYRERFRHIHLFF
jgi:LmbE family N-acetylglucosaminyl deacetylase